MCKIYSLWKVVFFSLLSFVVVHLALAQDIPVSPEQPQAPSEEPQRPAVVAFVNVNVVPMDRERILPGQTVIVRADRISEIGPADTTEIPEGAIRIDGRDKYLMPGLVDMHVHQNQEYQLTLFIAKGVTTIRNMLGRERHLRLRERIKKGELIGPTIYTAGPGLSENVPSREVAMRMVADQKKTGYDFIKVGNYLSLECYDAIIEAAAKHGMPVVGHVPSAVGLEHVLAACQHCVEHLRGYDRFLQVEGSSSWQPDATKIPYIARATREAGTWNCVTLVGKHQTYGMSSKEAEQEHKLAYMKYVPPGLKHLWRMKRTEVPDQSRKMSHKKRLTKALHDAGARILLGTDTQNPYRVSGFSLHQELRILVDAGLRPYEAIKAGTRDAAECLGEQDEFGTISAGLRADLILIENNPLEDVGNAARLNGVMARGRWLPQSELQAMLDALAIKHATEEDSRGVMVHGLWYPRFELEPMVDWYKERMEAQNESQKEELVEAVLSSDRIFLEGRLFDELPARSAAMKLMQLGLQVYVAEDATTPAIEKGDLLIAFSRLDKVTRTYKTASAAKSSGAGVVLLTQLPPFFKSRIRDISDLVFVLDDERDFAVGSFVDELVTLITEKRRKN